MVGMYIPEQGDDPNITNQYYDIAKAGTLDVLGATFQETLYYNPLNAVNRLAEQYTGLGQTGKVISKMIGKKANTTGMVYRLMTMASKKD